MNRSGWSLSSVWRPYTLADGLAARADNFLLLRMLAAAAVIYGHGPAMVGHHGQQDLFVRMGWGVYSGTLAVDLFFLTSGFLVTGSFLRRHNVLEFLWARALRVLPGYLLCLLGCAFVLGAIYTILPLPDYLAHPGTRDYVLTNAQLGIDLVWRLPGVFTDNPRRDTINGSIWTLPAEVRMYLWVALVGLLGILSRRALCNGLLFGLFVLGLIAPEHLPLIPHSAFVRLAGFFALGVFCYLNRDRIPANGFVLVAFAILAWLLRSTPVFPYALGLAEAAFVFWFAYRTPWYGYNRAGDYSYGLYLWGYPAQQVMAHHFPQTTPLLNSALSLPLAAAIAIVSWHLVERPAIGWKALPRRWWQAHVAPRLALRPAPAGASTTTLPDGNRASG